MLAPPLPPGEPPKSLTLEDRIAARHAIEEVYWRHRTWPADNPGPKPSLDQVLPPSAIRARVRGRRDPRARGGVLLPVSRKRRLRCRRRIVRAGEGGGRADRGCGRL